MIRSTYFYFYFVVRIHMIHSTYMENGILTYDTVYLRDIDTVHVGKCLRTWCHVINKMKISSHPKISFLLLVHQIHR